MNAQAVIETVFIGIRKSCAGIVPADNGSVQSAMPGAVLCGSVNAGKAVEFRVDDAIQARLIEKIFMDNCRVEKPFINAAVGNVNEEIGCAGKPFEAQPGEVAGRL